MSIFAVRMAGYVRVILAKLSARFLARPVSRSVGP